MTIFRTTGLLVSILVAYHMWQVQSWSHQPSPQKALAPHTDVHCEPQTVLERRQVLQLGTIPAVALSCGLIPASATASVAAAPERKCTDIESCREIGDEKVQRDLEEKPVTRLESGVRYKKLKPGVGTGTVQNGDTVDIIYSISRANGAYMYSQGFGFEKVQGGVGGSGLQSDEGLDSYIVQMGKISNRDVPMGVEQALVGMRKGERRRIEVPPNVGFETSNWKPEPTTRRGKAQIVDYQTILNGRGSNQPPFPAPTIWDVEVLSFRSK
jgi:FKBP-type peptidyl-prolyl cis-trans isomerase